MVSESRGENPLPQKLRRELSPGGSSRTLYGPGLRCGFPCRLSAAVQQDAGNKQCRDDDQSNDKALPAGGMSGRF